MRDENGCRTGLILGVAGAGLLLGHWLTYLVDVPSPAREHVLAASGHGYMATAAQLASVLAAICVATLFLSRLTRREPSVAFASTARRLAAVQTAAFVAMEVLERIGAGAGMHDLASILPIGVGAQMLVALAGAWLLRRVVRAADAAANLAGSVGVIAARATSSLPMLPAVAPARRAAGSVCSRAPPSVS